MTHAHRAAVVIALAGLAAGASALPRFASGEDLPAARDARPVFRQLERLGAERAERRVVIELGANPTRAQREALEASGVRLLSPLGGGAYFATLDRGRLRSRAAADAAPIRAVLEVSPSWKLAASLAEGAGIPRHAVVAESSRADASVTETNPVVGAYVVLHRDVAVTPEIEGMIAGYGGVVRDNIATVNGLVVEIPLAGARLLAREDAVQWVEAALPRMGENNVEAAGRTQASAAQVAPYGLDGSGVTAFIYDGGAMLASHADFQGRASVLLQDTSGLSDHATHVAGTVGSRGSQSGMATDVTILSAGFEYDGSGIFLYTNPGDFEADYATAIALGADLSNNSIGTNTAPNGFPCEITGDYGVMSSVIDSVVGGSLGGEIVVFWANGNERQTTRCGNTYATTAPPASAKNHITVGALNANDDSVTSFTSWGPVDDGRLKPDISAPGCSTIGDGLINSTSSTGGYTGKCGTSMASPAAAGCGALFIEDWRVQRPGLGDPWNSTVKAFFAHNAADIVTPGPDYQSGYGSIRIVDTIDHMRTGRFREDQVDDGGSRTYRIAVNAGETVKLTLAWDDAPGVPNTTKALVNDLDLRVLDPQGNRVFPWTLDPSNPGAAAVRTAEDHVNNIEQVYLGSAGGGFYTVEVNGFDVPEGPQRYSLVSSHDLAESLAVSITSAIPGLVTPGTSVGVDVAIDPIGEAIVAGSERLHYRVGGSGGYAATTLQPTGVNTYSASLPAVLCGGDVEFFVSAEGSVSGVVSQPLGGVLFARVVRAGAIEEAFRDDLEVLAPGWVAGLPSDTATTGQWEWADPEGTGAQPEDAHSGTHCWVTGPLAGAGLGSFDIDGGVTTLTTPAMDVSGLNEPVVSYYRWFSNTTGGAPSSDIMTVQASADGVSWAEVEVVGPTGSATTGGWFQHSFRLGDILPGSVEAFRLRFIAGDTGEGSLVEAAIDDIVVTSLVCENPPVSCVADLTTTGSTNGVPDGQVNGSDFTYYLSLFAGSSAGADLTTTGSTNGVPDGQVNGSDFTYYLSLFAAGCP